MTKLVYITHPSVELDKSKPPHEWGLSEKGFDQAKILIEKPLWKEVDVIYSSTEPKAVQVAQLASEKYHSPWFQDKDLGEADRTVTPFLPQEEYMSAVQEAYLNPDDNIRGWESHHHMMKRNVSVLEKIKKDYKGKTIVIIGHGGAGTTIKCYIKGIEPQFSEDPKQTGCIFIADLDSNVIIQDWQKY
ncbi:MAG: histidine phosphatase family protein [Candidatus Shapirobacteria bacterium]|jgi:broad specificity phosphatase PhoE